MKGYWSELNTKHKVLTILIGIIVVLVTVFIGQNLQSVQINFLWIQAEIPVAIVIFGCVIMGACMTYIWHRIGEWQKRKIYESHQNPKEKEL